MRTDGADIAAARLEALRRPAPPAGWVPDPALLGPVTEPDDPPEPDLARFWSGVDAAGPPPGRGLVSRRAAVTVVVAVAAVVAGIAVRLALPAGEVTTVPSPGPVSTSVSPLARPLPSAVSPAAASVVVHVAGRVRHGGLVTLPGGARVADAVRAAGGAAPGANLGGLNLARHLVDGEQVVVPGPGQVGPALPATAPAAGGTGGGVVDLNAATEEQFDALPGIGPVIAGRIVAWRQEHGRFTSVDELAEVQGIGDKLLAGLRDQVRV